MTDRILTIKDVLARIPYSRTTLWRHEKAGAFPKRVRIGLNRIGYFESEIEAWLDEKRKSR